VAADVPGFDAVFSEIAVKGGVKGEGPADLVSRVQGMDPYLGSKELSVLIGGSQEMVVGEQQNIRRRQALVKG
jgi:hypothetical protein